jgi:hypothetical protein
VSVFRVRKYHFTAQFHIYNIYIIYASNTQKKNAPMASCSAVTASIGGVVTRAASGEGFISSSRRKNRWVRRTNDTLYIYRIIQDNTGTRICSLDNI